MCSKARTRQKRKTTANDWTQNGFPNCKWKYVSVLLCLLDIHAGREKNKQTNKQLKANPSMEYQNMIYMWLSLSEAEEEKTQIRNYQKLSN